jgi:hypothetical protein
MTAATQARRFARPDAAGHLAELALALIPDGDCNPKEEERAA